MIFLSPGHLLYAFPFFELMPQYKCPPTHLECTHVDNCLNPELYPVDWTAERSLYNWVESLNLQCAEPYQIGLFGSMYFAGSTALGIFVSRAGDVFGRKWVSGASAAIALPLQIAMIFSRSIALTTVLSFLMGTTHFGRGQVSFVYICELVPKKNRTMTGSLVLFLDSATIMILSFWFLYVS